MNRCSRYFRVRFCSLYRLLIHEDVRAELYGGTKIDSFSIAEDELMVSFTLWEISGRMTGFQIVTRDSNDRERIVGPFGGGHSDKDAYPHEQDIPGEVLYISGLWDDQRIINMYFYYKCSTPSPNITIGMIESVCTLLAVGNPSGIPTNMFNDKNVSKNGRITALKVIHDELVNA